MRPVGCPLSTGLCAHDRARDPAARPVDARLRAGHAASAADGGGLSRPPLRLPERGRHRRSASSSACASAWANCPSTAARCIWSVTAWVACWRCRSAAIRHGLPPGRIVCLGSPLEGQRRGPRVLPAWGAVARCCSGTTGACWSRASSAGTGAREVGMIAGRIADRAGRGARRRSRASTTARWRWPRPACRVWPIIAWSRPAIPACCFPPTWRG